jgi:pimeloyl-ACP methyl ester carboxylesterase
MPDPETWLALCVAALVVFGPVVLIYLRYRREIRAARERLQRGSGRVIETSSGLAECAVTGEGPAVIVAHGVFGGCDQGLVYARRSLGDGFRAVVPSRFGYLRTPLPDGASPSLQADAYVSLLDALDVSRAAILGVSAGGISAIRFALRHPDRCSALVLISSTAPGQTFDDLPSKEVAAKAFRSDLLFWLMMVVLRPALRSIMGVPEKFKLKPEFQAELAELTSAMLPAAPRSAGSLFDFFVAVPDLNNGYPLEEIAVPTLIVSALDDPLTPHRNAQTMAERIPGARLIAIEIGGAMLLGHGEQVTAEVSSFLRENV